MLAAYYFVTTALNKIADRFEDKEKGASAVEYALMVALIAVVIIGTVAALGTEITKAFEGIKTAISGANSKAKTGGA